MGPEFDELAKALASGQSKRRAWWRFASGVAGGILATLVPGLASADECKRAGKPCKKDGQCCSGVCCGGVCCEAGDICVTLNSGAMCMKLNQA
jgi:hypothetical protein